MSDNPMKIKVTFNNETQAKDVESILIEAENWINEDTDEDTYEERWLSDYILKNNLDEGISFDSFLYPDTVEVNASILNLVFIGSPSGNLSGDIVAWLGKKGAMSVKGTLFISMSGDIIELDYSF